MNSSKIFLCGDIGETHSRLNIYMNKNNELRNYEILYSKTYINSDFDKFDDILLHFIQETNMESLYCISLVCTESVIKKNIPWSINKKHIEKMYATKVCILNESEAYKYGLNLLKENEIITLNKGIKQENDVKCCFGLKPCFGHCLIINNKYYINESDHISFSPETRFDYELQQFIQYKYGKNVTIKNIISGIGIINIYEFMCYKYPEKVDDQFQKLLQKSNTKAKIISSSDNILCKKTIELFLKYYSNIIRNYCLKLLPYGGCYIIFGFISLIKELQHPDQIFMKTLLQDHMKNTIETIPIYGVLNDELGERGAYIKAFQIINE